MNIIIAHSYINGFGGGERFVLEEVKHLSKKHDIKIITGDYVPEKTFPEFKEFDIHVMKTKNKLTKFLKWAYYKEEADLINAHGFPSNFVSFRNNNVVWYVHTDHFISGYGKYLNQGFLKKSYAKTISCFDKLSVKRMKKMITNSNYMKGLVNNFYGIEPSIVHPGVNPKEFKQGNFEDYILLVSRISPEKNIELAIKIMNYVMDLKLIIVGGWSNEKYLKSLKINKNKIEIKKGINNKKLKELYANCLCVLQTALNEPFGIVPLEGMASGKPVIAPNKCGFKETITKETGFLLEPDAKLFAEKINYLKNNKAMAKRMGKKGLLRAKEFDWKKQMRLLEKELLNSLN